MSNYDKVNEPSHDIEQGFEAFPSGEQGFEAFPSGANEPQEGETQPDEPEVDERQALGMVKETTLIEYAAGALAIVSVSTAVATMLITGGFIVNGAGIFAILLGPYSYWQQRNITDVKALKETHEALVREVDILSSENERLKGLVDDLGTSVDKLEDMEDTFDYINEMNIESVDEFRQQVKEAKINLRMMKKNLKASALQNVITVVLNSDMDRNFIFEEAEVEKLIENLKAINGLEMNEKRFRNLISENHGSVDAVVRILNDIVHRNQNSGDEIFRISDRTIEADSSL